MYLNYRTWWYFIYNKIESCWLGVNKKKIQNKNEWLVLSGFASHFIKKKKIILHTVFKTTFSENHKA